jgi:hypothetical protein
LTFVLILCTLISDEFAFVPASIMHPKNWTGDEDRMLCQGR